MKRASPWTTRYIEHRKYWLSMSKPAIQVGPVFTMNDVHHESYVDATKCHCDGCARLAAWHARLKNWVWYGIAFPPIWIATIAAVTYLLYTTRTVPLRYDQYLEVRGNKLMMPSSDLELMGEPDTFIAAHFSTRGVLLELGQQCFLGIMSYAVLVATILILVSHKTLDM